MRGSLTAAVSAAAVLVLLGLLATCRTAQWNVPPESPQVPSGGTSAFPAETCWIHTAALDPDGDSISVRFNWGDGDTSFWSRWCPSGDSTALPHAWQIPGTYFIRAQARDTGSRTSVWSEPARITIHERPEIRWQVWTGSPWRSSPAIGPDGTVYAGSDEDRLWAIAPDGTPKWGFLTGGMSVAAPVVGLDSTVYIGSDDGNLYAVNPDGSEYWRYSTQGPILGSPAIGSNGNLYFGSSDQTIYGLNPDGTLSWFLPFAAAFRSAPVIGQDGTIYLGADDGIMYSLTDYGELRWRYATGGPIAGTPALAADGTICFGSSDYYFYALNPDSTLKWRVRIGPAVGAPAIAADGSVYVTSQDGNLWVVSPAGAARRLFNLSGTPASSPALAADGTIYVGAPNARFYALWPDGSVRWRFDVTGAVATSPVIANDGAVIFGSNGFLYAMNGTSPLAASSWPMFQHDPQHTGRAQAAQPAFRCPPSAAGLGTVPAKASPKSEIRSSEFELRHSDFPLGTVPTDGEQE